MPGSRFETIYTCSNCNREMPKNFSIKEGDQCPYCKVRFDYREDSFGRKHYSQTRKDQMLAWTAIGIGLASILVVGIVIGVIVKAVRD
jgi:DNA-directed RNA polymerase subunit RPC12/RpoP